MIIAMLWAQGSGLAQNGIAVTGSRASFPLCNLGFRQEFNTYLWNGDFSATHNLGNRWQFLMQEQYRTSMLQVQSDEDKWTDDQSLRLGLMFELLPSIIFQANLSSVVFLDKQSGLGNDFRTHWGSCGLTIIPLDRLVANLKAGPKLDSHFARNDRGLSYSLDMTASNFQWDGYDNSLHLALGEDRFAIRRNNDFNIDYNVQKEFVPGTSDSLRVYSLNRRRDNYASALGDIESLREDLKGFDNMLSYKVAGGVQLNINSTLQYRDVQVLSYSGDAQERQRKRSDQIYNNGLVLFAARGPFHGTTNFSYSTQQQRYDIKVNNSNLPFSQRTAFVAPDNKSGRLFLSTDLTAALGRADSLSAYFSVSRYQYDTPDTSNFDDHDELRINSRMTYRHRLNPNLTFELQAGVNLYHLVYIFGERSADNNWNRIFRLEPSVDYFPSARFRLKQSFEVLANYVDYDFEDQNVLTKSFVFRKFAIDDSLRWSLSRRSTMTVDYRLQLEENGQLSWEQWTERILVTRQSHWSRALLNYSATARLGIALGYSYYLRYEWQHKIDSFGIERKEKNLAFASYGPILRFWYVSSNRLRLTLDSARQAVDSGSQKRYYINTIDLRLNWYL